MPGHPFTPTTTCSLATPPAGSASPAREASPPRRPWAIRLRRGPKPGAQAQLDRHGDSATLQLAGDWQAGPLPAAPTAQQLAGLAQLRVAADGLQASDARLPAWLWPVLQRASAAGAQLDLQALPTPARTGLEAALAQAMPAAPGAAGAPANSTWLAQLGRAAALSWQRQQQTLNFLGQVLLAAQGAWRTALSAIVTPAGRVAPGQRSRLRLADIAFQFEQVGPRSLPIVLLVSALVGLILAYMGGAQLELFGAQSFVAPLVSIGEVREIGALVVGIVLAGRVGAAFAAQLATMRGNEEIDALCCLGVDPVDHLVLPRLLALLLAAPLLTVLGAAGGALAGGLVSVGIYGVAPREYLARSIDALTLTHVAIGVFKGLLYGLLVGLAGCCQGLHAERSAQGVGRATTDAVVQAIVWLSAAAAATTVIFHQLGW